MAYDGWIEFGGVELVNLSRTVQLADALGIDSVWISPSDVAWIETALGGSGYDLPANAPWHDAGYPASAEFAGIIPLGFPGLDDSTAQAETVEYITDGGKSTKRRNSTLAIVGSVAIIASTDRGAEYGKRWLDRTLKGSGASALCVGSDLRYFRYKGAGAPVAHRRDVALTRGATITRKRSTDCAVTWLSTFTLTCGDPFEYGEAQQMLTRLGGPNTAPDALNYVNNPRFALTENEVLTNLAANPRATAGNGGFQPNNAYWSSTLGVAVPSSHPQGIATSDQVTVTDAVSSGGTLASLFDVDAMSSSGTSRFVGCWVYSAKAATATIYMTGDSTGTTQTVDVPANAWTFVHTKAASSGYAILVVAVATGGTVVNGDSVYVTGVIASTEPVIDGFFDGAMSDNVWTYAWNGAANASSSTRTGPVQVYQNYISNPDFETDANGWGTDAPANITISRTTAEHHSGTAAMQVVSSIGAEDFSTDLYSLVYAPAPGDYAVSIWVKGTAGKRIYVGLGGVVPWSPTAVTCTGGWQRVTATGHAANAGWASLAVTHRDAGTYYYDDACAVDGTMPQDFNGGTAAAGGLTYSWLGAAHGSHSVATALKPQNWQHSGGKAGRAILADGSYALDYRTVPAARYSGVFLATYCDAIGSNPAPGEYYAAKVTLRRIPNAPVTGYINLAIHDGTTFLAQNASIYVADLPADGSPVEFDVPADAPATNATHPPLLILYAGYDTNVRINKAIVSKTSGVGGLAHAYFDGDTPDGSNTMYGWTGTAELSTSYAYDSYYTDGPALIDGGSLVLLQESCPVYDYTPIYDPLYPALVPSPTAPEFYPAGWNMADGSTFERFWARVSPVEPSDMNVVPLIKLRTDIEARMVRVSIWAHDSATDDQCGPLFSTVVSYLPPNLDFFIDGEQQASYVVDALGIIRRTDSLVYSPDAKPVEWAAFNDPTDLLVTLDLFADSGGYEGGGDIRAAVSFIPKSD